LASNSGPANVVDISAVIATIGNRRSILETIRSLKQVCTSLVEIIVVLPPDCETPDFLIDDIKESQIPVLILVSTEKGQVRQRQYGVSKATTEYIIYCDDDIELTGSFPVLLPNFVVAPVFADAERRVMTNEIAFQDTFIAHLAAKMIGFRWSEGRVTVFGLGLPFSYTETEHLLLSEVTIEREWLPGGCIIFPRSSFPDTDYYPFEGYAYGEDVLLSLIFRSKGLLLAHVTSFRANLVSYHGPLKKIKFRDRIRFYWNIRKILYFLIKARRELLK